MLVDFKKRTLRTQLEIDQHYSLLRSRGIGGTTTMLGAMYRMFSMLVMTENITLTPEEEAVEEFRELRSFFEGWKGGDLSEAWLWDAYLDLHPDVVAFWIKAYDQSEEPLLPRHQLDGRSLTPEEKETVTSKPDDPFPS